MRAPLVSAAALAAAILSPAAAAAREEVALRNWAVPAAPVLDGTFFIEGSVFVPLAPCRIADTRDPAGPYGGPILAAATERDFDVDSHPTCASFPPGAQAYSLNITIVAPAGVPAGSFVTVWPKNVTAQPLASTQNFQGGDVVANALIVRAGDQGTIAVISNASVHVILDINGVFTPDLPVGASVEAVGSNPGGALVHVTNSSNGDGRHGLFGYQTGTGRTAGLDGRDGVPGPDPSVLSQGVRAGGKSAVVGATKTSIGFGVWGRQYDAAGATSLAEGLLGANFGTAYGVYASTGTIGCNGCAKQFVDPHPTDPTKVVRYVALEGGEAGTYFRGTAALKGGRAVVELPDHFRFVTDEEGLTVHVTPVGGPATVWVESYDLRSIAVRGTRDVVVHFMVRGVRPAFKDFEPIAEGTSFLPRSAAEPMPAAWSSWAKRRLVENGTYREDGFLNRETARRAGWTRLLEE